MPLIRNALVVGGGIAGMSAALVLSRLGIEIDLVDQDPDWRVYGAGISITGPTLRAFQHLGILEDFRQHGYCASDTRLFTPQGHPIGEIATPPLAADLPAGGGIMRPILHEMLASRTRTAAADIRLGVTVDSLTEDAEGVDVQFSDGREGRYDLVIGADGIYSRMRTLLFPEAPRPRFTGQACWRITVPRPPQVTGVEMYLGAPIKAGVNPCAADKMYLFALESIAPNTRHTPADLPDLLRQRLSGFGGAIAFVRDQITDDSIINFRPLEALLLPGPWHTGRTILIGDAAHATTPHLASGAGMAMEDAVVLGAELAAADSLPAALSAFMARRFDRAALVVNNSVRLGEIEQSGVHSEEHPRLMNATMAALAQPL
ncbi:FAD-dependent oxidoreductase [Niveispirillum sp. KHB5.9]|uniref:FAD-dependent oxidoreductase n=1 Tax=Niveispirillum sp. KHB5.9 TaxID=3400269 RepID=UPI003A83AF0C